MTVVNTYVRNAIADHRIADLRRDAAPRPEPTAKAVRKRRLKPFAHRTQTVSAARAERS